VTNITYILYLYILILLYILKSSAMFVYYEKSISKLDKFTGSWEYILEQSQIGKTSFCTFCNRHFKKLEITTNIEQFQALEYLHCINCTFTTIDTVHRVISTGNMYKMSISTRPVKPWLVMYDECAILIH
jgi:hypothetical protein